MQTKKISKTAAGIVCLYRIAFALFIYLFTGFTTSGKNYYLSSKSGSDNYTATQAQNLSTPWKSISKLNANFSGMAAGDSVLFKRGETFYGSLTPIVSGIIFSAYGTGNNPILSGFTSVTSWTSLGGNLWKSAALSYSKMPCMLMVNNWAVGYGRFPNSGYNYLETHSGTNSITDNQLSGTPNFKGGELVIRINGYELNRHPVSSHSGATITFTGNTKPIRDNFGYFIQNHLSALDVQNEWCIDNTSKAITMYSTTSPAGVKVSTLQNVCKIDGVNNLTFKNISFEGGNGNTVSIVSSSGVIIDGCEITNSGISAVACADAGKALFQNCKIYNSYDNGFDLDDDSNSGIIIRNNTISKSGTVAGMGLSGSGSVLNGVGIAGSGHIIEYNNIDSCGYTGIIFKKGSNNTIRYNFINTYCFVKHDGGGIYTWNNDIPVATVYTNNKIIGNIIINGIGAAEGTANLSNLDVDGIMMDDNASNVTITDNTVANVPGSGIYIHNNFNMDIQRNTVFNCGSQQVNFAHNLSIVNGVESPYTTPLRNITFKKNILFSKTPDQTILKHNTILNDIDSIGSVDSNYYARPLYEDWIIKAEKIVNGVKQNESYELTGWKKTYKKDAASKKAPKPIPSYKLNSLLSTNMVTNGQFTTGISGINSYSSNKNQIVVWDNTGKLTSTGSLKISFPLSVANMYTLLYSSVGTVRKTKNYILRFTTLGTGDSGMLRVYMRLAASPYTKLTPLISKAFGKIKTDHEFLFTAPDAGDAVYAIELAQNSGTVYIDNIELYEANVTMTNPDDLVRFEYNPTNVIKTISLNDNYLGVDSSVYAGTLSLAPYSSKILIKDTSIKIIKKLSLSVTAPAIACFGGSTNISLSAAGGTAPYTGTGSFTVSAGTGSLKLAFPSVVSNVYTLLYSSIGAVASSKNYVLRYSTLGTTDTGSLRVYIRKSNTPFNYLSPVQTAKFGKSRVNHKFLFTAPTTDADGSFAIEVNQNSGTVYIDNIEFYEATTDGHLIGNNLYSNGRYESNINKLNFWSANANQVLSWDNTSKISTTYTYVVKDASGASADTSVTVVQPAAPLSVAASAGMITTFGGTTTVTVTATGGTAPYTGTGSFTAAAGSHTYTVTDANGCYASTVITLVQPTATLAAAVTGGNIACFNDKATVTVSGSGGIAPYTGTGDIVIEAGTGALKLSVAAPVAGSFTKLYGAIGPLGANKNYLVRFSTLGTTTSGSLRAAMRMTNTPWTTITPYQTAVFGTARVDHELLFKGLTSQSAGSFLIEINQSSGMVYIDNIAVFEASVSGATIGSNLFPSGKFVSDVNTVSSWSTTANHTIVWDNTSKMHDTYYFTITDATGSSSTASIIASQPAAALQLNATAPSISVKGGTTTVTVTATGGTAPYTGTGTFTKVPAGTYTYTVTDANGCTASKKITLTQPLLRGAVSTATAAATNVMASEFSLTAYPNPASTEFSIGIEGGTFERIHLTLLSADGRVVQQAVVNSNQRYTAGRNLKPGIYIIQAIQGSVLKNIRVVKIQ